MRYKLHACNRPRTPFEYACSRRVPNNPLIVVGFHLQKVDPNRLQVTARVTWIKYTRELTTIPGELTTIEFVPYSVLVHKEPIMYVCMLFYLRTPIDIFEYINIPLLLFPSLP